MELADLASSRGAVLVMLSLTIARYGSRRRMRLLPRVPLDRQINRQPNRNARAPGVGSVSSDDVERGAVITLLRFSSGASLRA